MTGDDLKRLQDSFLDIGKKLLQEEGRLRPVGFVVTLRKHVDALLESGGWILQVLDPKAAIDGDATVTLVLDLLMDWQRLYHAALHVLPASRAALPQALQLAKAVSVDDPYMRTMRPFLQVTGLNEKDLIGATMRAVCGEVNAYASVLQAEAWMRYVDPSDKEALARASREGLGGDMQAVEVLVSLMETYDISRALILPIQRAVSSTARDEGAVTGFGQRKESLRSREESPAAKGRFEGFLKPLSEAS